MSDLRLEVDLPEAAWLGVPVDADQAWAAEQAASLATGDAAGLLAQELEVVVRRVQAVPRPLAAAALLPDVGDGAPSLLAVLVVDEVALDDDLDALVRTLDSDAEGDARPAEIAVVALPAGRAVRTHRLWAEPGGVVVEVLEHLVPAGGPASLAACSRWRVRRAPSWRSSLGEVAGLTAVGARAVTAASRGLSAARGTVRRMTAGVRSGMGRLVERLPVGEAGHLTLPLGRSPRRALADRVAALPPATRSYFREVERLGVATPDGAANFYSGGRGAARRAAERHADDFGTTTLERTPGGKWLDDKQLFGEDSPLSVEEADALWRATSGKYAEGASGPVRAYLHDPRPEGCVLRRRAAPPTGTAPGRSGDEHRDHRPRQGHQRGDRPMTLTRTKPQQVTSSEGWQVASAGREAVLYRDAGREARAGVDRGPVTRLYVDDLAWVDDEGRETALSEQERALVLPRLVAGLEFLGMVLELFRAPGQR